MRNFGVTTPLDSDFSPLVLATFLYGKGISLPELTIK